MSSLRPYQSCAVKIGGAASGGWEICLVRRDGKNLVKGGTGRTPSFARVVGGAHTNNWEFHAFIWDANAAGAKMADLGTHPDQPGSEGYATVINDRGTIGGHGYVASEDGSYPMISDAAGGTWVLVAAVPGLPYAEFYDIGESGRIVGMLWYADQFEDEFITCCLCTDLPSQCETVYTGLGLWLCPVPNANDFLFLNSIC